jgi:uncharacterized membrane protein (Fun14 family)
MSFKDHFALILNEPAGKIAKVIVEYAVKLVVKVILIVITKYN